MLNNINKEYNTNIINSKQITDINTITVQLLDNETVKKISVCQITSSQTLENGIPKQNGLLDPRMGSIDRNIMCSTCWETKDCPGHFGHIELKKRVLNPFYLMKIKKILESICSSCSSILNSKESSLNEIWKISKNKMTCPNCMSKQPNYKKEGLNIYAMKSDDTNETKIFYGGDKIHEIFSKIKIEDLKLLKIEKDTLDSLIIKNLPVPPLCVRPSVIMEGLRAEDDLTHKLNDIIKSNNIIESQEIEGAPSHVLREYEHLLQFHVATMMNNEISSIPQSLQKSGRPIKSISSRIKGKEGRVRGNLMGKRVDFSSRSVITAEPNIGLNELGVPKEIAMVQTFPEIVTDLNIEELRRYVQNGPLIYPGANFVKRLDGQRIDLKYKIDLKFKGMEIEKGMIVERHLLENDIVLFNRQPTLHKMGMMAHRIKIVEGNSFRLNLSATTPYNADFDGDEMNMHSPQSYASRAELEICTVDKCILSPQTSSPCMFIVQDSLVGVYLLTDNILLTEKQTNIILYNSNINIKSRIVNIRKEGKNIPCILRPKRFYTGKQIFSLVLEEDLIYKNSKILILDGNLIKGRVCKKSVGTSHKNLIHILFLDYGNIVCMNFYNKIQRITNNFLLERGFSVGVGDIIPSNITKQKIKEEINKSKIEVEKVIQSAREGKLKRSLGLNLRESFESKILEILNKSRDQAGKFVQQTLLEKNNLLIMINSGSKGSFINISQVSSCVGQQSIDGRRISFLFDGKRSLSHYVCYDYSPESKGFVQNSYLSGLNCKEFFFHSMGGREGLIDTSCKTSETGYLQRKLIKSMENVQTQFDKTIRDGIIISFIYGGDQLNSMYLEKKGEKIVFTDVERIVERVKRRQRITKTNNTDSIAKITNISEIIDFTKSHLEENLYIKMKEEIELYLRDINTKEYKEILEIYKQKLFSSLISPREMVGTIASQSIGQPATQMTLNTFHFAGVLSREMMGVPRLKEILNVSSKIKTPSMKIILKANKHTEDCNKNPSKDFCYECYNILIQKEYEIKTGLLFAKEAQSRLQEVYLKDFFEKVEILYEPFLNKTEIEEDKELAEVFYDLNEEEIMNYFTTHSKYLLRIKINREKLIYYNYNLKDIKKIIDKEFGHDIYTINSDLNDNLQILRLRTKEIIEYDFMKKIIRILETIKVGGYKNIERIFLDEKDNKWNLMCDGTNLDKILSSVYVNPNKTVTNDLIEIEGILGIEAARRAACEEFLNTIKSGGSTVNLRHIELLTDCMTNDGKLRGLTRHGTQKRKAYLEKEKISLNSALKRSSFEQTVEVLMDAALQKEKSKVESVTDCLFVGKLPQIGTNVDLELDLNLLEEKTYEPDFEDISLLKNKMMDEAKHVGFDPTSPQYFTNTFDETVGYKTMSPNYSPMSPNYSPMSPGYSPMSPKYSPMSPKYSPMSPKYSPMSPQYSPASPKYSPMSPKYSPMSPKYSPVSPKYKQEDEVSEEKEKDREIKDEE